MCSAFGGDDECIQRIERRADGVDGCQSSALGRALSCVTMDDLNTELLQSLRAALLKRQAALRQEVDAALRAARQRREEASHEVLDQKDEAEEHIEASLDDHHLTRDIEELRQIELARQRLDDGRYGYCVTCGEPINLQRLLAQPAATHCTACQALAEAGARASRRSSTPG
jgi:DnaK suppressor protein